MTTMTRTLDASGVQWASSKAVAETLLRARPGVTDVDVNPISQTATIEFDPDITDVGQLTTWIQACGLHCAGESLPHHLCPAAPTAAPTAIHSTHPPHDVMGHGGHGSMSMEDMVRDMRRRFIVAAALSVPILLWSPIGREVLGFTVPAPFGLRDDVWSLLLSIPVIAYSAWIFFDGAWRALRARTLDMMVLVAIAVGAGWGYSLVITLTGGGEVFYEAATVLTAFVLLGHWLEMRARGGANDAVRALLELAPPRAIVVRDGAEVEVPTSEVVVGDTLVIRPGARVPVDAIVVAGASEIDESMVTGESMPVPASVETDLIGGSVNGTGALRARATKVGADTALAQIVTLVQKAQNSKAPGQRLADRAAFWLVLVALAGAALTFAAWTVAGAPVEVAILFAITVIVVACPDALGLATPMALMVGTGLGAQRGILFKSATAIENSARIDTVVMDKTGTLTLGQPTVTDIAAAGLPEADVLRLAAAVESSSEHPLARAIVSEAHHRGLALPDAADFTSSPGRGAAATVEGHHVVVGSRQALQDRKGTVHDRLQSDHDRLAAQGRTPVFVGVDGVAAGVIALADATRPTSREAVATLKGRGIRVVMLTGDNQQTADRIATELGVDHVIAGVLPESKAMHIRQLQDQGHRVAMVGDGVNDAPALAQADVGVAIGTGTDVAIETADVVLMRSDPTDVGVALAIGAATVRKMRQNLAWAIGYNAVALPIAAGVFMPAFGIMLRPEIAALAMSGSSLIVAMNALMLRRTPLPHHP